MRIIENPKTKLESVDLIDDNGVLLRITPESLVSIGVIQNTPDEYVDRAYFNCAWTTPRDTIRLKVAVRFLGRELHLHFTGEDAVKIAESLNKLKGY